MSVFDDMYTRLRAFATQENLVLSVTVGEMGQGTRVAIASQYPSAHNFNLNFTSPKTDDSGLMQVAHSVAILACGQVEEVT